MSIRLGFREARVEKMDQLERDIQNARAPQGHGTCVDHQPIKSIKATNATEWDQWPICFKLIWHKYEHLLEMFGDFVIPCPEM